MEESKLIEELRNKLTERFCKCNPNNIPQCRTWDLISDHGPTRCFACGRVKSEDIRN